MKSNYINLYFELNCCMMLLPISYHSGDRVTKWPNAGPLRKVRPRLRFAEEPTIHLGWVSLGRAGSTGCAMPSGKPITVFLIQQHPFSSVMMQKKNWNAFEQYVFLWMCFMNLNFVEPILVVHQVMQFKHGSLTSCLYPEI